MKLKQIIIQGFKSFADKTTIHLTEGTTAIVGPNGSGKSNIVEAIRWVMGETSAKSLRGEKMADVIFAGTASRKPVNIAEVTIVLDNIDHFIDYDTDDVTITRRLGRDGKSDYFINKKSARLKDITDIFTDSGLGKESFSIVSQGQVEAVFNSKPKERRGIFEEAAGVLKFKERKNDAEKQLEETSDNLDRVKDILFELEKQRNDLETEKNKAETYLDVKKDFDQSDIFVTTTEIIRDNQSLKSENDKHKNLTAMFQKSKRRESELDSRIQTLKQQEVSIRSDLDVIQSELLTVVQNIERTESDLKLSDERSKQSHQEKTRIEENIIQYEDKLNQLNEIVTQLDAQIYNEQSDYDSLLKKQKAENKHFENLSLSKEDMLANLRSEYIEAIQTRSQLNNQSANLTKDSNQLNIQNKKFEQSLSEMKITMVDYSDEISELKDNLNEIQNELKDLIHQHNELSDELGKKQEKYDSSTATFEKNNRTYQQSKQKYDTLVNMQQNYSGFYQGVQKVMQHKDDINGIVGTVAELIRVPSEYQTAIDLALGGSSQHIIVEDDKAGRFAIDYLKKNNAGRATFLPLTTMSPRYIQNNHQETLSQTDGFVAIASDLINYDAKIEIVIKNLLGNIVVADNLSHANQISRQINRRYRVVTLDGDVINVGGSMTGGSRRKSQSAHIFSQQNDIESLEKTLPQMKEKVSDQADYIQNLEKDIKSYKDTMEDVRLKGEAKRNDEQRIKQSLELKENAKIEVEKQEKATTFELKESKKTLDENKEELELNVQALETINDDIERIQSEMDDTENVFANQEKEKDKVKKVLDLIQNDLSEKKAVLTSVKREKAVYLEQINEVEESLNAENKRLESNEKPNQIEPIEQIQERKATLENKHIELNETQTNLKTNLSNIEDTLSIYETELKTVRLERETTQENLSNSNVMISKLESRLSQALTYLIEEHSLSFEETKDTIDCSLNYDQEKQKVIDLKRQIKSMGPVNLQAIEDFEQIDERYRFMSEQRDDLLEAREDLFGTMDQMDEEVATRFEETFYLIQESFAKVFPKMFGGGRAELVLTDPDDMLETGVEIKAQPPGKKLQHLSLLSGGERALTAISLLFAIIHTRPIPFVILDEVEAALDDANVLRFSHYLKNFNDDHIQFIVITHRKGTMEGADNLYGVVMQEKGVSSIVSVRLSDVDDILDEKKG